MTTRAQFMNRESFCVWLAAATSTALSLSNLNVLLTTLILLGTLIYTWRKALRKWPKAPKDDTEL